jgi:hypothetical protein
MISLATATLLTLLSAPGDKWSGPARVTPNEELRVDPAAATSTLEYNWCPSTASTTLPDSAYLRGAKAFVGHNRSTATIYVTWDGQNATTDGAIGDEWKTTERWSMDVSAMTAAGNKTFILKAAATAQTISPKCLHIRWWK